MDEIVKSEVNNIELNILLDEKKRKWSIGFIITIICSVLAISFLCLIIMQVPTLNRTASPYNVVYSNFFFRWYYREGTPGSDYFFDRITLSTGFFIFMPISTIFFILSTSTIFVKNLKEQRICFIINFVLGLIPIILFPVRLRYIDINFSNISIINILIIHLGLFVLYFIPLQLLLLIDKKNFLLWSGLQIVKKEANENFSKSNRILRIINFVLGILVYLFIAAVPYFTTYNSSAYSVFFEIMPLHVFFALLCWMWFCITFVFWQKLNRVVSFIVSFLMPVFIALVVFYITIGNYWFFEALLTRFGDYSNVPELFMSYAAYFSFFLIYSLVIGFYSQKSDHIIIAAIHSFCFTVFYAVLTAYSWYPNESLGIKFGIVFQFPFIALTMFLGAHWGRLLKNRIKSISKISA